MLTIMSSQQNFKTNFNKNQKNMKTKKLKISDLKMKSFVTTVNSEEQRTINGGTLATDLPCLKATGELCIYYILHTGRPETAIKTCTHH